MHAPFLKVAYRFIIALNLMSAIDSMAPPVPSSIHETQITRGKGGRVLTNSGVWSPDGQWIVYDVRSDPAGEQFDGARIEMVNVETGKIVVLYQSHRGAYCGVATFHPKSDEVVFILGPESPTADWQYGPSHRQGGIVSLNRPGVVTNLDARDLVSPFTSGALRGGSHVHVWDPVGEWVSFTYNDALVEADIRDIGVTVLGRAVAPTGRHPRNHSGAGFSVLVTDTRANPEPGSDQITRACEEGWVGINGYVRSDGSRQPRALAFQGHVVTAAGSSIAEVFIVDLPHDLRSPRVGPLCGTETHRPFPPAGTRQRRLTFTANRKHPGIQGPRHWLRSSPDGSRIAFLMKDDVGVVQLWTISPNGGKPVQLTSNAWPISSAFTWSPDGRHVAHVMDNSVSITDTKTGETSRLTERTDEASAPRPEACVFSPDGKRIAYVRRVKEGADTSNQIFVVTLK